MAKKKKKKKSNVVLNMLDCAGISGGSRSIPLSYDQ